MRAPRLNPDMTLPWCHCGNRLLRAPFEKKVGLCRGCIEGPLSEGQRRRLKELMWERDPQNREELAAIIAEIVGADASESPEVAAQSPSTVEPRPYHCCVCSFGARMRKALNRLRGRGPSTG